jgi:hypothetical protein
MDDKRWEATDFMETLEQIGSRQNSVVKVSFRERLGSLNMSKLASLGQGGLSPEPMWDNRIPEIRALKPALIRLFIQEYFNLMPELGKYNFAALDRSVETILKTGAKPLMCICFKPKALFPQIDQDVVEPNNWDEWKRLVFNLVKHYRDMGAGIRYWEISNEPDIGEDGGCPYRFQPERYVRYYRHTAEAILQADPNARVGGPALANVRSPILPKLLEECSRENVPIHFVSWHIYTSDPLKVRETIKYVKCLIEKCQMLKVETILDEWNMDLWNPPSDPRFQPCFIAETIWQMLDAGLDYSCYYHIRDYHVDYECFTKFMSPRGAAFMVRWWNRMPQHCGLFDFQNKVRPAYFAFKLLSRMNGQRLMLTSSHNSIHGLAVHDEQSQMFNLMLWNFSNEPVSVEIHLEGLPKDLFVRHIVLDAVSASDDENVRLKTEKLGTFQQGKHCFAITFEPYAVHFWSFE